MIGSYWGCVRFAEEKADSTLTKGTRNGESVSSVRLFGTVSTRPPRRRSGDLATRTEELQQLDEPVFAAGFRRSRVRAERSENRTGASHW